MPSITEDQARTLLKKHAASYGDQQYEPALWVVAAMQEAAEFGRTAADQAWLDQVSIEDNADVVARRMGYPNAT